MLHGRIKQSRAFVVTGDQPRQVSKNLTGLSPASSAPKLTFLALLW
jgi:hypothetical protein